MKKQDEKIELLPCPFCGNIPELITRGNEHTKKRSSEVYCKPCNLTMIVGAIRYHMEWTISKVTEKWNTRPSPAECVGKLMRNELRWQIVGDLIKHHMTTKEIVEMYAEDYGFYRSTPPVESKKCKVCAEMIVPPDVCPDKPYDRYEEIEKLAEDVVIFKERNPYTGTGELSMTIRALFDLYAKDMGYSRNPKPEIGVFCLIHKKVMTNGICAGCSPNNEMVAEDRDKLFNIILSQTPLEAVHGLKSSGIGIEVLEKNRIKKANLTTDMIMSAFALPRSVKELKPLSVDALMKECGLPTILAMLVVDKFGAPRSVPEECIKALEGCIEHHGALHDDDCPEDDTCDCVFKHINDGINKLHSLLRSSERSGITKADIVNSWHMVGSTHHPILKINGKIYHFMNKEELANKVITLLESKGIS